MLNANRCPLGNALAFLNGNIHGLSYVEQAESRHRCVSRARSVVWVELLQSKWDTLVKMERIAEPELMDGLENAAAYARADFSEPNTKFVCLFSEKFPAFKGARILDLGCGPADIPARLAALYPQARVTGVDGAKAMLDIARQAISQNPAIADRVEIQRWYIGREACPLPLNAYAAVVSNSLLHHLEDPLLFWRAIRACALPGAAVLVMDLFRPATVAAADRIVETYADGAPEVFRNDFRNSLHAAYRPDEILDQLASVGLASLQIETVSDRHLLIFGSLG